MGSSRFSEWIGIAALGVFLALPGVARAAPRVHDGLELELQAGLGYLSTSATVGYFDIDYQGPTLPIAFEVGATIGPVTLGAYGSVEYALLPEMRVSGGDVVRDQEGSLMLSGAGVYADIHPHPGRQFHLQPFVGWSSLSAPSEDEYVGELESPSGPIFGLGVGYGWWLDDEWSHGPLFRLAYAPLRGDDVDWGLTVVSFVWTFTYH